MFAIATTSLVLLFLPLALHAQDANVTANLSCTSEKNGKPVDYSLQCDEIKKDKDGNVIAIGGKDCVCKDTTSCPRKEIEGECKAIGECRATTDCEGRQVSEATKPTLSDGSQPLVSEAGVSPETPEPERLLTWSERLKGAFDALTGADSASEIGPGKSIWEATLQRWGILPGDDGRGSLTDTLPSTQTVGNDTGQLFSPGNASAQPFDAEGNLNPNYYGNLDTFGKPQTENVSSDSTGFDQNAAETKSCDGWFCSVAKAWEATKQVVANTWGRVAKEFGGDAEAGNIPNLRATLYYPGGCSVAVDPGCSPGIEGPRVGSRSNYIDRDLPVIAAGNSSGLRFGDVVMITNPNTGLSTYGVVGDHCPSCGKGIDITPAIAENLGTYQEVNRSQMQVELVSRGNAWSEGLAQAQSLRADSSFTLASNGSRSAEPTDSSAGSGGFVLTSAPASPPAEPVSVTSAEPAPVSQVYVSGEAPPFTEKLTEFDRRVYEKILEKNPEYASEPAFRQEIARSIAETQVRLDMQNEASAAERAANPPAPPPPSSSPYAVAWDIAKSAVTSGVESGINSIKSLFGYGETSPPDTPPIELAAQPSVPTSDIIGFRQLPSDQPLPLDQSVSDLKSTSGKIGDSERFQIDRDGGLTLYDSNGRAVYVPPESAQDSLGDAIQKAQTESFRLANGSSVVAPDQPGTISSPVAQGPSQLPTTESPAETGPDVTPIPEQPPATSEKTFAESFADKTGQVLGTVRKWLQDIGKSLGTGGEQPSAPLEEAPSVWTNKSDDNEALRQYASNLNTSSLTDANPETQQVQTEQPTPSDTELEARIPMPPPAEPFDQAAAKAEVVAQEERLRQEQLAKLGGSDEGTAADTKTAESGEVEDANRQQELEETRGQLADAEKAKQEIEIKRDALKKQIAELQKLKNNSAQARTLLAKAQAGLAELRKLQIPDEKGVATMVEGRNAAKSLAGLARQMGETDLANSINGYVAKLDHLASVRSLSAANDAIQAGNTLLASAKVLGTTDPSVNSLPGLQSNYARLGTEISVLAQSINTLRGTEATLTASAPVPPNLSSQSLGGLEGFTSYVSASYPLPVPELVAHLETGAPIPHTVWGEVVPGFAAIGGPESTEPVSSEAAQEVADSVVRDSPTTAIAPETNKGWREYALEIWEGTKEFFGFGASAGNAPIVASAPTDAELDARLPMPGPAAETDWEEIFREVVAESKSDLPDSGFRLASGEPVSVEPNTIPSSDAGESGVGGQVVEPSTKSPFQVSCSNSSIVNCLEENGLSSDLSSRRKLAQEMGLTCSVGTATCNIQMLDALQTKGLPVPLPYSQPTAENLYATAQNYKGDSIINFLKAAGQPSDYASRAQLAASYGITNYRGSAAQNLQLLQLLRKEIQ